MDMWIWELGVGMGVSVYGTGDGRRETETGEYLFKGRRERVGSDDQEDRLVVGGAWPGLAWLSVVSVQSLINNHISYLCLYNK